MLIYLFVQRTRAGVAEIAIRRQTAPIGRTTTKCKSVVWDILFAQSKLSVRVE